MVDTEGSRANQGGERGAETSASKKVVKLEEKSIVEQVISQDSEGVKKLLSVKKENLDKAILDLRQKTEKKLVVRGRHKDSLDKFIEETDKKAKAILSGRGSEVEKFNKLEKLKKDRIEELRDKVEEWKKGDKGVGDQELNRIAQEIKDKETKAAARELVEGMISLTNRVKRLEETAREIENFKENFDRDQSGRAKRRLSRKVEEFVSQFNGMSEETNNLLDKVSKFEVVELSLDTLEYDFQLKIQGLVRDQQSGLEGMEQAIGIEDKIQLLEARFDVKGVIIGESSFEEILGELKEMEDGGKISGEVAKKMREKIIGLKEMDLRKDRIKKGVAEEAVQKIQHKGEYVPKISEQQLADFLERNPGMRNLPPEDRYQQAWLEDPNVQQVLNKIGASSNQNKPPAELSDGLLRRIEGDPNGIDESVENINFANAFREGRHASLWEGYKAYASATESQFRPDRLLNDAKRDIVKIALERVSREGEGAEFAVTKEDVKEWVLDQMNRVIAGGEEATSYTARQFLQEVSGILEKKDLKFGEVIGEMKGLMEPFEVKDKDGEMVEMYRIMSPYSNREIGVVSKAAGDDLDILTTADHVTRVDDDFRDEIGAAIIIHELSNAYSRAGSVEDMLRISSAVDTEKFAWVLKMESPGRQVEGRLKFYEVGIDEKTGKREVLERGDFNGEAFSEEKIKQIHTAEKSKGGLNLVIAMPDGTKKIVGIDDFKDLLTIKDAQVSMKTGDLVDILNQERVAVGLLSKRKSVKDKFEKEAVREAIAHSMGLVDIDGEVNWEKVQELVVEQYGQGASFELINRNGENLTGDSRKVRMKMVMDRVGDKVMNPDTGMLKEQRVVVGKDKDGVEIATYLGGMREDGTGIDDMMNEFKMTYKLADGIWKVTGLAAGHWSKDHSGELKDWHQKIIHFIKYVQQYGIGPGHLRQAVNLDYHDFITRRKGDIIPALFGEHTYKKESLPDGHDAKMHRKDLIGLLVEDRDGYVMSRQRMLNIFGNASEKEIRKMLTEKAKHLWGESKGEMLVKRHWDGIREINWGEVIKDKEGLKPEEMVGFKGLRNWAKRHYRYAEFNWGKGGESGDDTWSQRWYKEMQYLMAAEKYRGAMLGWLTGKPKSPEAFMEATSAAGWYGQTDQNRKNSLILQKYREYFGRVGSGFWPATMETVEVDPYNLIVKETKADPWDGSMRYGTKKVITGKCLAKEELGMGPLDSNQFHEITEQLQRAGKLTANVAHEMTGRVAEAGLVQEWISNKVENWLPGPKQLAKGINFVLFGGHVPDSKQWPLLKYLPWEIFGAGRMSGVLGWIWKKLRQYVVDTWAVRKEIRQGMMKAAGEQAGSIVKVD